MHPFLSSGKIPLEIQTKLSAQEDRPISLFKKDKFIKETAKNWDLFYKRNSTNFFKDRHWLNREFLDLDDTKSQKTLFEIGCGVGNLIFPQLKLNENLFIHACDFSKRAIDFVHQHKEYNALRLNAFVCDITTDDIFNHEITPNSLDLVSNIFCLSAIPPDKIQIAIDNLFRLIKPGGRFLFRDYGLLDHAQLRFKPGHRVSENFYVRQDGTFSYYFSIEDLEVFFNREKWVCLENKYILKQESNTKDGTSWNRVFIQARFEKK